MGSGFVHHLACKRFIANREAGGEPIFFGGSIVVDSPGVSNDIAVTINSFLLQNQGEQP
jgi:hypothetical protein